MAFGLDGQGSRAGVGVLRVVEGFGDDHDEGRTDEEAVEGGRFAVVVFDRGKRHVGGEIWCEEDWVGCAGGAGLPGAGEAVEGGAKFLDGFGSGLAGFHGDGDESGEIAVVAEAVDASVGESPLEECQDAPADLGLRCSW